MSGPVVYRPETFRDVAGVAHVKWGWCARGGAK